MPLEKKKGEGCAIMQDTLLLITEEISSGILGIIL